MHLLFTVYDSKAETYLPPFFVPTVGIATRAFADCVNSDDHQFGKHPADYTLFRLGTWDDDGCTFDITPPVSVGNGVEFLEQPTPGISHEPQQPAVSDNEDGGDFPQ